MKKRLDILVFERGLAKSRESAKALIMAGNVLVGTSREDKPGSLFDENVPITVKGPQLPYVSRGGLKLEKAMSVFPIDLKEAVCLDIGASTGGFTDCMLQNGAARVFAIDVGYGQLAWKLRCDERVVCMEKTNIRYVTPEDIGEKADFASIDVSFISLKLVLPVAAGLLKDDGMIAALIKPQFEAGREKVGKKGVVRDPSVHLEVIESVLHYAEDSQLGCAGLTYSPVKGPEGNIEYLIFLKKQADPGDPVIGRPEAAAVVADAHAELDKQ